MTVRSNTSSAASATSVLEEEALDWFVRRMGSDDDSVEPALLAWLSASPEHRAAYARWEDDWVALDAVQASAAHGLRPAAPSRLRHAQRWMGATVACCAMFAVVGLALTLAPESPQYTHHYATQAGQSIEVALPDGSEVALDTGTSLDVALFAARREVTLPEGQAVFHVHGDAARPFDVIAGPARITVIGTRFAVRHTPNSSAYPGVHIAVESGRVQVAVATAPTWRTLWREPRGSQVLELRRGQQLTLDAKGSPGRVMSVDADSIAPWRRRQLSFEDITLREALAEFARYGPLRADIRDDKVAALRVTGTFDADTPDTFYRLIAKVLPVRVHQTAEGSMIEASF